MSRTRSASDRLIVDPDPSYSGPRRELVNEEGVDLRLIDWALCLTPDQRLAVVQEWVDSIFEIRNANRPH
jgi:hypothetical protein